MRKGEEGDGGDEKRVRQLRDTGESRGDKQGTIDIDHIEEDKWEDCQDAVRERRTALMIIKGRHEERADRLAQIQNLGRVYFERRGSVRQGKEIQRSATHRLY